MIKQPKRCAECGGKFGLTRRYSWRTSLCSGKCLDAYVTKRNQDRQWLFNCVRIEKA